MLKSFLKCIPRVLIIAINSIRSFPLQATSGETDFQTDNDLQSILLSARKPTQVPFQMDQALNNTHRTVTAVLSTNEGALRYPECGVPLKEAQPIEFFSPESTQSLLPPDEIYTDNPNLGVSQWTQTSLNDLSSVSLQFCDYSLAQVPSQDTTLMSHSETFEDVEFSPGFKKVLSDFETRLPQFKSKEPNISLKEKCKRSQSPPQSDSDLEFYECRQEFSEPDDKKLEHDIAYHVFEPLSQLPKRNPDSDFVKSGLQSFSQSDGCKCSFGSEHIEDDLWGSEGSLGSPTEGDLPLFEEFFSRDQAGFYDGADDDFLKRVRG